MSCQASDRLEASSTVFRRVRSSVDGVCLGLAMKPAKSSSPGGVVVESSGRDLEALKGGNESGADVIEECDVAVEENDGCDRLEAIDECEVDTEEKVGCCMLDTVDACEAVTEGIEVRSPSKYESDGVQEISLAYVEGGVELVGESWRRSLGDKGEIGVPTECELAENESVKLDTKSAASGRACDRGTQLIMAVAWSTAVIRIASYL